MKLVRVVAKTFVAAFETDGVVRRAAPILKALVGMTDDEAREHIWSKGWHASVIAEPSRIVQHWESFEVLHDGKRDLFYFDTNAFRRGVTGRMSMEDARAKAIELAGTDQIEIDPEQPWPPPWKP